MLRIIRRLAAKELLKQQNKPTKLAQLTYAFTDSKGMRYYTWANLGAMPMCRKEKLMEMIAYSNAKIDEVSLRSILTEQINIAMTIPGAKTEKVNKAVSQVVVLANEILNRQSFTVPKEIMLRNAAIVVCREDEKPDTFIEEFNEIKVSQFKKEMDRGYSFFLTTPLMIELYDSLIGTTERLAKLLIDWEYDQRRIIQRLRTILQSDESKNTKSDKMP